MASMSVSLGHSRLSPATLKTFPMHHLQFKNPQQSRLTLSPNTRRRRAASVKVISEAYTTVDAVEGVPLPVLTYEGESAGEEVIDLKKATEYTARAVVHRGVITQLQNRRRGTASTLTRGQVRGGGRKPYSQKGTGRARRGSQRSPLIVGGGVIFGPKPKDWTIKINKKERRLALSTALMSATVSTTVVEDDFLEKLQSRKTKDFISLLKRWGVLPSEHSLLFCTEVSDNVRLGCRNLKTVKLITPRNLNLYDVLRADKLLLTRSGVRYLNCMYGYDVEEGEEMLGEEEEEEEEEQAPQQEEEDQGQEEAPQ